MTIKPKVYIEIVERLRDMISKDVLGPGDRIPSERELSERLGFGRSSVREALRALELLGLIETKRGEGTFIKDFQEHQLVELLGTFILQDQKVQTDAIECKHIIEKSCIDLLFSKGKTKSIHQVLPRTSWEQLLPEIVKHADNRLLYKIWKILSEYVKSFEAHEEKSHQLDLFLRAFDQSDRERTLRIFDEMHNLSK